MERVLIISPHLDDAVLSCGDLIAKLIEEGKRVDVLTIFSGLIEKESLSPAALKFHSNCFLDEKAMTHRKKEDKKAHKLLKCNSLYLNMPECLYRSDSNGHLYPDLNNIYYLDDRDNITIYELSKKLLKYVNNYEVILCPLGLGSHADHLVTNYAINSIKEKTTGKLYFYEDVAYVCYYYRENEKSNWGGKLLYKIIEISEKNFQKKIDSVLIYRSQLNILWENYFQLYDDLNRLSKKYGSGRGVRIWYYDNI